MKFLWICDPSLYTQASQDVPTLYQHLARDPRIEFFHAPINAVVPRDRLPVVPVPKTLTYTDFLALDQQPQTLQDLSEIDLVFCRRLKPFPPGYLDVLSIWETHTRFVNSPFHKKEQMTAAFLQQVAQPYVPEMLVTHDPVQAEAFLNRHQQIVAKTANSCGGRGVFKIWLENQAFHVDSCGIGLQTFPTFAALIQSLNGNDPEPLQFVRYLKHVTAGDKRVVVVDGEIYGAYLRRSKSGHWINNVSFDGECVLAEVTPAECAAIEGTVGHYQARGLHTLGYDFLLDDDGTWRISEINAGNIGGFARLEALTGEPICDRFLNWLIEFAQRDNPKLMHSASDQRCLCV